MIPPKANPPPSTSYADSLKKPTTTERSKGTTKTKIIKKHVTTVKPKAENCSSIDTRKTVQAKLDIRTLKIGVKQVRNIRNGGIIIETETETDLDKLIQEFKLQDDLAKNFDILKPDLKKPQIICFDVSQDTSGEKLLEDLHSQFSEVGHGKEDFHIEHHFNSKRGVNWIVEINPCLFKKVMAVKRIALGWGEVIKQPMCGGVALMFARAARVQGAWAWGCDRLGLGLLCSTTHQLTDGFGLAF
ncbi:uncharacterized protein CEXT_9131 [Caerostris extrusa]|uniref:Uncharacterized protein n=1 Tax=Caerostris extrusa TaxID=172846 RepID=A0AAV4XIQ8_CAEEX|nr:uncharacterized protein CEXT_9131 [Caerostris extrusa]